MPSPGAIRFQTLSGMGTCTAGGIADWLTGTGTIIPGDDDRGREVRAGVLMQFFLTVPHDSAEEPTMESMDPGDLEAALAAVEEFNSDLNKSGAFRFAGGLHPPSSAKTVDATSGEPVVVDGPFVEAAEYVGGFWVIEAEDEDAAVRWATQASKALGGRIEVRAFQDPQDS